MKEKLEFILKSRGMSFYRLSKLTGIGESTFSALRLGKTRSLSIERLELIAKALNLSLDEFRCQLVSDEVHINQYLKSFRKTQALSLEGMAKCLGVTKALYTKTEQGTLLPSYDFITKLKKAFPEFDLNRFF